MHYYYLFFTLLFLTIGCVSNNPNREAGANEDYLVIISTKLGDMKVLLYDQTPQHKENFIKLVREGFYDSLLFHRVIKDFMIQGGDPESKNAGKSQPLGGGGPGYKIPAEINSNLFHKKGALAAARLGDNQNPEKESSGSQFYIVQGKTFTQEELEQAKLDIRKLYTYFQSMLQDSTNTSLVEEFSAVQASQDQAIIYDYILSKKDTVEKTFNVKIDKSLSQEQIDVYTSTGGYYPLDGEYTVFGQVVEGLDIIDKLASVETNNQDRPNEDVRIMCSLEIVKKSVLKEKYPDVYK